MDAGYKEKYATTRPHCLRHTAAVACAWLLLVPAARTCCACLLHVPLLTCLHGAVLPCHLRAAPQLRWALLAAPTFLFDDVELMPISAAYDRLRPLVHHRPVCCSAQRARRRGGGSVRGARLSVSQGVAQRARRQGGSSGRGAQWVTGCGVLRTAARQRQ
jgi:hypothetical protein